jgi:hypothetical protein
MPQKPECRGVRANHPRASAQRKSASYQLYLSTAERSAPPTVAIAVSALCFLVDVPRFEVPGVAVLRLFKDPVGNATGLVEMQAGKPKVP